MGIGNLIGQNNGSQLDLCSSRGGSWVKLDIYYISEDTGGLE